jgi:hypothetical protein
MAPPTSFSHVGSETVVGNLRRVEMMNEIPKRLATTATIRGTPRAKALLAATVVNLAVDSEVPCYLKRESMNFR